MSRPRSPDARRATSPSPDDGRVSPAALRILGVGVATLAVLLLVGSVLSGPDEVVGTGDAAGADRDEPPSPTEAPGADTDDPDTDDPDTTATTEPRGELGSGEPVTLAFAGDATFQGLEARLASDPQGLLSAIAPVLGSADLTVVNLEAALATGGVPAEKQFNFRVPSAALDALGAAGTDVVSMANNHGMDFGAEGLAESLRIRASSSVAVIGIGEDAEDAYRPHLTEIRGQRIAVMAANDVFNDHLRATWIATDSQPGIASAEEAEQARFLEEVAAVRPQVDTLVVFLHYGLEPQECPNSRQEELVDAIIGAGADIVVGSATHRLHGMGYRGDRFVAYGLSNFVFQAPSPPGKMSGVLKVTVTGRRIDGHEWVPAELVDRVPVPLTGSAAQSATDLIETRRQCTNLTSEPQAPSVGQEG